MPNLIHLIYSSGATVDFSEGDVVQLLEKYRSNNSSLGVTGMLLYADKGFFQILEGEENIVDQLFEKISQDKRHAQVVTIIREPIRKRSFGEWSMGHANITQQEIGQIVGFNDFFMQASCFGQVDQGRAKKLLAAFKEGRWRSKVRNTSATASASNNSNSAPEMQVASMQSPNVSFAYQPIIDANLSSVISFEALLRGPNNESAIDILRNGNLNALTRFDSECRAIAIGIAARLGLTCNLNLNFMAHDIDDAKVAIRSTLDAAEKSNFYPSRIVLEIDQDMLIGDIQRFAKVIEEFRGAGLKISIDHFGEGRAGLNLLEPYRPEMITLNENLVRGIESNSSRQAIVRGVLQTCNDLGIDIIAKSVHTLDEYWWFRDEGIHMFQGNLFASSGFEQLPTPSYPTE